MAIEYNNGYLAALMALAGVSVADVAEERFKE